MLESSTSNLPCSSKIGVQRSFAGVRASNGGFSNIGITGSRRSNAWLYGNAANGMPAFLRAGAASIAKAYWLIADRVGSFGKVVHFHNSSELFDWLFPQQFALCFLH